MNARCCPSSSSAHRANLRRPSDAEPSCDVGVERPSVAFLPQRRQHSEDRREVGRETTRDDPWIVVSLGRELHLEVDATRRERRRFYRCLVVVVDRDRLPAPVPDDSDRDDVVPRLGNWARGRRDVGCEPEADALDPSGVARLAQPRWPLDRESLAARRRPRQRSVVTVARRALRPGLGDQIAPRCSVRDFPQPR